METAKSDRLLYYNCLWFFVDFLLCLKFPFLSLHSFLFNKICWYLKRDSSPLVWSRLFTQRRDVWGSLRRDALSTLRQGLCGKTMPTEVWRLASGKAKQEPRGNIHLQIPLPKEFKHVTAAKSGKRLAPCSQIKIAGSCQIPDSHCNVSLHVYIMEV